MDKCITVMHVVPYLDVGGIETMLYNYYCNLDREKIKFNFIVHGSHIGEIEKRFIKLGSNVYHITPKKEGFLKYIKELKRIIQEENFDIVHVHQSLMSFIPLYMSKKAGVKIRIAHSHGNNSEGNIIKKICDLFFSFLVRRFANFYFACGLEAAQWVFGKNAVQERKVKIIRNAIDLNKFKYNRESRVELRNKLGVDSNSVIAQIGRFTYEKNHSFAVDILNEIIKTNKNFKLVFIGDGKLKEDIIKKVRENHLEDYVLFMGNCDNVFKVLSAMDVLILPSLHEGLPLTPIEAQATGLKCFISNKVTEEIRVTDLVEFIDINDSPNIWANKIINSFPNSERTNRSDDLIEAGYHIEEAALALGDLYRKYSNEYIKEL